MGGCLKPSPLLSTIPGLCKAVCERGAGVGPSTLLWRGGGVERCVCGLNPKCAFFSQQPLLGGCGPEGLRRECLKGNAGIGAGALMSDSDASSDSEASSLSSSSDGQHSEKCNLCPWPSNGFGGRGLFVPTSRLGVHVVCHGCLIFGRRSRTRRVTIFDASLPPHGPEPLIGLLRAYVPPPKCLIRMRVAKQGRPYATFGLRRVGLTA